MLEKRKSSLFQDLVISLLGIILRQVIEILSVFVKFGAILEVVIDSLAKDLGLIGCHSSCCWKSRTRQQQISGPIWNEILQMTPNNILH